MAETSHTSVRDGHADGRDQHSGTDGRETMDDQEHLKLAEHPYKGKHIDLSM